MLIALVEQLNFEKQMLIDGNCKQQITIAVPCTGANAYTLVTYFMINLLRCGPDYVFDGANLFYVFKLRIIMVLIIGLLIIVVVVFFKKLEVLQAGNVLQSIDN